MRYAYPCIVTADAEGWLTVTFRDVPEAGTDARSHREALTLAAEALAVALAGYVHRRRDIPTPGKLNKGEELVSLSPVVAAKLALYVAMRSQDMSEAALAARLGLSESAVHKLTDPDHRSRIDQVENALKALGRTLVVEDRAA